MLARGSVARGSASSLLEPEQTLQYLGAGAQDLTFKPHPLQKYSPAVCAPSDWNAKKVNEIANLRTVEIIIRIPMIKFWQQILMFSLRALGKGFVIHLFFLMEGKVL